MASTTHRPGHFLQTLEDWQAGKISDQWFDLDEHPPIEENTMPRAASEDGVYPRQGEAA